MSSILPKRDPLSLWSNGADQDTRPQGSYTWMSHQGLKSSCHDVKGSNTSKSSNDIYSSVPSGISAETLQLKIDYM